MRGASRADRREFLALWPDLPADAEEQIDRALAASSSPGADPDSDVGRRWYAALKRGERAFDIYAAPDYAIDMWACWVAFSRPRLLALRRLVHQGYFADVETVADLGCGHGDTTLALAEIFPAARVWGTNLEGPQTEVARAAGVRVAERIAEPADLVFASEYFEHFEYPLTHLREVLEVAEPRYLIAANSFGARAPGHFDVYFSEAGHALGPRATSRAFGARLRAAGYGRWTERTFWNTSVWKRRGPLGPPW